MAELDFAKEEAKVEEEVSEEEVPSDEEDRNMNVGDTGDDGNDVNDGDEGGELHFNDDLQDQTYSRRIARYLSKYNWYLPKCNDDVIASEKDLAVEKEEAQTKNKNKPEPPVLDDAWEYFEHYTLARYIVEEDDDTNNGKSSRKSTSFFRSFINYYTKPKYHRAEIGEKEKETKLYPVVGTPELDLGDWGIGVGIYFWSLRNLSYIMFIAGLISIYCMVFYNSTEYDIFEQESIRPILKGSVICTDNAWVPCPNCTRDQWSDQFPATSYERYASANVTGIDAETGVPQIQQLNFILRNGCRIGGSSAFVAYATLIFICVAIYLMSFVTEQKEIAFDEAEQTATDYSIEVTNPPLDAKDVEEWKEFFDQFSDSSSSCVSVVTIAYDNEELINKLVLRRSLLRNLKLLLKLEYYLDYEEKEASEEKEEQAKYVTKTSDIDKMVRYSRDLYWWEQLLPFMFNSGAKLKKKILKVEDDIANLVNGGHVGEEEHEQNLPPNQRNASNIFVTFETEQAQRKALQALSLPNIISDENAKHKVKSEYLFRGKHVLKVIEPGGEPDSIRWHDLDEPFTVQMIQSTISILISVAVVAVGAICIAFAQSKGGNFVGSIVIAAFNQIAPQICKQITKVESHSNEGSKQASLYIKMTFFRWVSTVIVTQVITPFTDISNADKLIKNIYAIFFVVTLQTPVMQLSDYMNNPKRHLLGPRSLDQERMNLNFQGGYWTLAERYTDMTKILFFTLWYSGLYPLGFFWSWLYLNVTYWTDKFCLLRSWAPAPRLGTQISKISRNYVFTAALVGYAVIQSYYYSGSPFDNACEDDPEVPEQYFGVHNATDGDGNTFEITISREDGINHTYKYCNQDMLSYRKPAAFPPLPKFQPWGDEWMTRDQEIIVTIFSWTSIGVLVFVSLIYVNRIVVKAIKDAFFNTYKPTGDATDIRFSDPSLEVPAYVPQIKKAGFQYPMLACDISNIDTELIGWEDSDNDYDEHNLIHDMPSLGDAFRSSFSVIKHWPPPSSIAPNNDIGNNATDAHDNDSGSIEVKS